MGAAAKPRRRFSRRCEDGRLDVPLLLTLTLRREQAALRALATRTGLGHDLLWLVADLAVSPFAHALLDTLFGSIPSGSPLATTARRLVARLLSAMRIMAVTGRAGRPTHGGCAVPSARPRGTCRNAHASIAVSAASPFADAHTDPAGPRRVVETCGTCHGYTKVVESERLDALSAACARRISSRWISTWPRCKRVRATGNQAIRATLTSWRFGELASC